jgi:hypothetical protein
VQIIKKIWFIPQINYFLRDINHSSHIKLLYHLLLSCTNGPLSIFLL